MGEAREDSKALRDRDEFFLLHALRTIARQLAQLLVAVAVDALFTAGAVCGTPVVLLPCAASCIRISVVAHPICVRIIIIVVVVVVVAAAAAAAAAADVVVGVSRLAGFMLFGVRGRLLRGVGGGLLRAVETPRRRRALPGADTDTTTRKRKKWRWMRRKKMKAAAAEEEEDEEEDEEE